MTLNDLLDKLDENQIICITTGDAKVRTNAKSAEMLLSKNVLETKVGYIRCKDAELYVRLIDEEE